jgi:hypothetical protein
MKFLILSLFTASAVSAGPIQNWQEFEVNVRDQLVHKDSARKKFPALYKAIKDHVSKYEFKSPVKWKFPVKGYTVKDAGKGGFRPDIYYGGSGIKGFDFFDGNKHGGHPAYDIFIRDKNRDCLDDRTKKPVNIVAPVDLFVLSTNTGWKAGSEIRGGNYICALNGPSNMLFYFAHLDSVRVKPKDFVKTGIAMGTIGRTGKNALPARSPTHVHMMVLRIEHDRLKPVDFWKQLENAEP